MTTADRLRNRADLLLDTMTESFAGAEGSPREARQFLRGFLDLIIAGADGNDGPRDNYLNMVVPGLKQSGIPLTNVVDGIVRLGMALAHTVDPQDRPWLQEYYADYSHRVLTAWEEA